MISSAQIIQIRWDFVVTDRKIISTGITVPKRIIEAMAKSNADHETSFVNCIAINGISNKLAAAPRKINNRVFLKFVFIFIYFEIY